MSELDLASGDLDYEQEEPIPAARERARERRERRRTSRSGLSKKPASAPRKTAAQKAEEEIIKRIDTTFDRIAEAFENREDDEMAAIFREEKVAMSQGLVNLTRNVTQLRPPLLWLLNIIEPLLSFGRLGRVLFGRFVMWRSRRLAEREQMMAEMQTQQDNGFQPQQPAYQ